MYSCADFIAEVIIPAYGVVGYAAKLWDQLSNKTDHSQFLESVGMMLCRTQVLFSSTLAYLSFSTGAQGNIAT
jgi:hypothetical protein